MEYYYLKKGEIIKEGDEVEVSNGWNTPDRWIKSVNCIGGKTPDPQYLAHRTYRREIKTDTRCPECGAKVRGNYE